MKKSSSSLSSSSSSLPSSWKLNRVVVENFKSITAADVSIENGFTSIFGPNGSGKSCFLEAIVFALGASLNNMRVDTMNQIRSTTALSSSSLKRKIDANNDTNKVLVTLYITKDNITKEISNSIIGNQRLYCIDKKKHGRAVFLEMISNLGFPRGDSFSYYISQRAVTAITQSTPKNLFQTISFSAGTHAIIEVRDNAIKKLKEYEEQLQGIENNIIELDADINLDLQAFKLLQMRNDINNEIKENATTLSKAEEMYKSTKALSHLELMRQTLLSISSIVTEKENQERAAEHSNDDENVIKIDQIEDKINQLENDLLLLKKVEVMNRNQLLSKKEEEEECRSVTAEIEKELLKLECTLSFSRSQREELIQSKIPGQILRIDNLSKNVIKDNADPTKLMKDRKKNLNDINDVYRYTESLLMALTDTAIHEIKEETIIQQQLNDLDLSIYHTSIELKAQEDQLLPDHSIAETVSSLSLSSEIQDLEILIKRDNDKLDRKIASLNSIMTNYLGIDDGYTKSTLDGDIGYVADLLTITNATNIEDFVDSLDLLIKPVLGVRVVTSRKVAIDIMNTKSSKASSLRIWPLENISSIERSRAFTSYIDANNDIIDPKTFLSIRSTVSQTDSNKLIFRIIDTWIFAKTNKTAAKILNENKNNRLFKGIITSDGLRHTYGSITVCNTKTKNRGNNKGSIVDALIQYQQLKESVIAMSSSLAVLSTTLENKKKLLTVVANLNSLQESVKGLRDEHISVLDSLEKAQKKVLLVRLEVAKSRSELTVLEDQRTQLIKDITELGKASNSIGMHQEQQRKNVLDANELLKEQEKEVTELGTAIMNADNKFNDLVNDKSNNELKLIDILEDITILKNDKSDCNSKINTASNTLVKLRKELDEFNSLKPSTSFDDNINERLEQKLATLKDLLNHQNDSINVKITNTLTITTANTNTINNFLDLVSTDIQRITRSNSIDLTNDSAASIELSTRRELIVLRERSKTLVQRQFENNAKIKKNSSALITYTNSKKKKRRRHIVDDDDDDNEDGDDEFEYARIAVGEKQTKVSALKDRFDVTKSSVRILEESMEEIAVVIARIQMLTFDLVRKRTIKYFSDLVPNKKVDLVLVGEEIKEGIQFVLLDSNNDSRSISELSGGQHSLLSLSFVIANAIHKAGPWYLLDEVDAALDERNQQAIAKIIQNIFGSSQVLCVSHHQCFLDQALNGLSVLMKNNTSIITKA